MNCQKMDLPKEAPYQKKKELFLGEIKPLLKWKIYDG